MGSRLPDPTGMPEYEELKTALKKLEQILYGNK